HHVDARQVDEGHADRLLDGARDALLGDDAQAHEDVGEPTAHLAVARDGLLEVVVGDVAALEQHRPEALVSDGEDCHAHSSFNTNLSRRLARRVCGSLPGDRGCTRTVLRPALRAPRTSVNSWSPTMAVRDGSTPPSSRSPRLNARRN